MKPRPFLRLASSPQAGFLVLPLVLAAAWPVVRTNPAVAVLTGAAGEAPGSVLWGHSITFSVVAGFMSGLITRDVLQAPFAFVIPGMSRRILVGKFGLGLAIAAFLGLQLGMTGGWERAAPIFSCTLLFFSLGSALADPIFPRTAVWIVGPLLVIPVWEPSRVQRLFDGLPTVGSFGALAIAAVLAIRELDPETARRRTLGRSGGAQSGTIGVFATFRTIFLSPPPWRGRPASGRMRDWVDAVHYETFGSRRLEWPTSVLWAVGLNCGMAVVLRNPSFAAVMGLVNLSIVGHRLNGRWAYPASRSQRADLLWVASLLDSSAYFLAAALVLPVAFSLDLPQTNLMTGGTMRYGLTAPLLVAFMAAPIVQWPRLTSNLAPPKLKQFGPLWLSVSFRNVAAVAIVTFVLELLFFVQTYVSMTAAVAFGILLGIAFQYYLWVNLRHHFRVTDLA